MRVCSGFHKIRTIQESGKCTDCSKSCPHTPKCSSNRWVSGCVYVPEAKPPTLAEPTNPAKDKGQKYKHIIKGVGDYTLEVDVYDVLKAFGVTCPARQHAIKKLLCAGNRGHKDLTTDLDEAINSVHRAKELLDD